MAMDEKKQPIVIKRIVKKGGHHGGAWKIAFADFAIAMMAFFLLLWILSVTDDVQKAAISQYFQDPSAAMGISPTPPYPTEGDGASPSIIDFEGAIDMERAEELARELDQQRLENLKEVLEEAMEQSQALEPFKDQLLLDITPEGLRIQIVDKENRPMFDLGSSQLMNYSTAILRELGAIINQVPNKISITGHTDARPFIRVNYSNWELSTDRANAARRAMLAGGMEESKVGRVVGLGSTVLFDRENPENPINRRISIIVMNQATEQSILKEDSVEYRGDQSLPFTP
ncbi:flagellar motor protein MotB [Ectothiorhodospira lacustris]|uniref:flagellar motor protein MotB n=1 Tax=Ectothiorhodospira lacustris TaxID=2899127 RepID=UPI001EE82AD7|nr:flagellar motor protein MotB [Ectothiorhodospira lacustris]MCG5510243.1 flagellar motor protein MotB [Ectothiorhodospira lacustris]MCG5521890.1 flagellar motor protein MotB [Ectothiorhodospira lacustris]